MKTLLTFSINFLFFIFVSFSTITIAQTYPPNTTYEVISPPENVTMPGFLETYENQTTNSILKRVTVPSDLYGSGYPSHGYAKTQPWNYDATLVKLRSNAIYDATTHEMTTQLTGGNVPIYFSLWSNTDPDIIYGFRSNGIIRKYTVSTDNLIDILDLDPADNYQIFRLGFGEGNIDIQDKYAAVAANPTGTQDMTIFVVDLQVPSIVFTKNFEGAWGDPAVNTNDANYVDWISVSQSGDYVGITWDHNETSSDNPYDDQDGNHHFGVELFNTTNMSFLRRIANYGNHGDFGFAPDGDEVYVQFWGEGEGGIFSYHLDDGAVDVILNHMQVNDDPLGSRHISCRNYLRPGWAYVNTSTSADGRVYAVLLDGSQTIENFGHTFATSSARPVPTPLGDKVLITSHFDLPDPEKYEFELYLNPAPLAVTLLSKLAGYMDDNHVVLKWQTTAEENFSGFAIEHSQDGLHWGNIGFVTTKGNESDINSYQYRDENPKIGSNYYRLKVVDLDGSYTYSNIVTIKFQSREPIVFPNPTRGQLSIVSNEVKIEKILVYSVFGQLAYCVDQPTKELDIAHLQNGLYTIIMQSKAEVFTELIVLSR